ncbi:fluoride efflux transporter CrcB [Acidovorax sp. GBBC 3334]|uniref:fluoride efflux transporter CrcB n=1 Tax=Acidovorax sp. GBBC 3334 TaxID=2940496 RepID=UPI002302DE73|nr:fluoride efflux transporter CrcB [Acidovorax sp. GBBC 3334]MDA8453161.1 fluoride efflux transporter CrcB [Acidovorax sp. GBBC 3334]
MWLHITVICLAACVGALMRWGFALWLNPGGVLPWGTLAVNLIGGYCIGIALAVFTSRPDIDPAWRLLIITGFLGTLTTFSSFSGEVVTMLMQQRFGLAFATIGVHLGGSLALTWAGMRTALWWMAR